MTARTAGTTTARGYGTAHQQLRKKWEPKVAAGLVTCWRCRKPIHPRARWDLGHDDHDRSIYRGPEHLGCNRGAAARKTNAIRRARRGGSPRRKRTVVTTIRW